MTAASNALESDAIEAVRQASRSRTWSDDPTPPPPPLPEPDVRARPADKGEIPQGAKNIAKHAERNGWDVAITYAKGPYLSASAEILRTAESILVRMRRGTERAAAAWVTQSNGKWACDFAYHRAEWTDRISIKELRKRLEGEGAA